MTAFAMGAATRPPVASLPAFPPCSTITATATCGSSAGANAVNQACGAWPVGRSARCRSCRPPGRRGSARRCPSRSRRRRPSCRAAPRPSPGETAVEYSGRAPSRRPRCRSADRTVCTRYGVISRPPLAIAAETIAICSGRRLHVALPDGRLRGDCGGVHVRRGTRSRRPACGMVRSASSNPNRSACSRSASAPRSRPSCANAVLQETRSASASVIGSRAAAAAAEVADASRWSAAASSSSGAGSTRLGRVAAPHSSAAAAVTSLNVEPGRVRAPASRCCAAGCRRRRAAPGTRRSRPSMSCDGERVRVEAGRRDEREDLAGRRLERDDGALLAAERVERGLLRGRVDRRLDGRTLGLAAGEQVPDAREEQLVGPAGRARRSRRARAACGR